MFNNVGCFSLLCVLLCGSAWAEEVAQAQAAVTEKLRDPTAPLGYKAISVAQKKLTLQAIYLSDSRAEAIVNGRLVKVGGIVDGATVIKIKDKSVVYKRNGVSGEISLRPNIVKNSR